MYVKGEARREQARTCHHHEGSTGKGTRVAPEHQSTRTVPAAQPHDPPSDGNDYEDLASSPQMWQCSQVRNKREREGDGSWRRKTAASFQNN